MDLLILDGPPHPTPGRNPVYRGTYRAQPTYCDDRPREDEINQLFFWFIDEGGQTGAVHDLSKALRFAELWNQQASHRVFEVVEIVVSHALPVTGWPLLGFDLSVGCSISLLQWGLRLSPAPVGFRQPCSELGELIKWLYGPQLNDQGLFATFEVASACLQSMIAVQEFCPAFFEGGDLRRFEVVGVYAVRP